MQESNLSSPIAKGSCRKARSGDQAQPSATKRSRHDLWRTPTENVAHNPRHSPFFAFHTKPPLPSKENISDDESSSDEETLAIAFRSFKV
jgi:hypothetical protein